MMRHNNGFRVSIVASLFLAICFLTGSVSAKDSKKIVEHPDKLKFGKLDFKVPDVAKYRHELSNGTPIFIAVDKSLPLVNISMTVRVGSYLEEKMGVAGMTGQIMRQGGAGERTAAAFDERVEFLATNMNSFIGGTSGGASMNCITGVLDESLDMFFEMLRTPRFEEERIKVSKASRLERLKQRNDNPAGIARREWNWLLRGTDHFTTKVLTKTDLDAIDRDDLIAFHEQYFRPQNMIWAVSGDIDPVEIIAALNARLEDWKTEAQDVPWPPPAPRHTPEPGVYFVQKDIPQGRVRIGHLGLQRDGWDDAREFPLTLMNDILGGGGFTSRLVKRIRSDEGLAYSAGSSFGISLNWPGTFSMAYQSKSETVAFAAQIAIEEMKRIREEDVSDEELEIAKGSLVDAFPGNFDSPAAVAGIFASDEYVGRPSSYWDSYRERAAAVTPEQIREAAKKYLDPDQLVMLIVGDWEAIQPGDADGRASMAEFFEGAATALPLRDPLTMEPMEN